MDKQQVLLYGTGNYIQYPVITIMEKNMRKSVCICITESLHCTAVKQHVIQLYFNKNKFKK